MNLTEAREVARRIIPDHIIDLALNKTTAINIRRDISEAILEGYKAGMKEALESEAELLKAIRHSAAIIR